MDKQEAKDAIDSGDLELVAKQSKVRVGDVEVECHESLNAACGSIQWLFQQKEIKKYLDFQRKEKQRKSMLGV